MALGARLDLRQSQALVMTPQLQQAIKLLALSNLEVETFIGDALAANPLLDVGGGSSELSSDALGDGEQRATTLEASSVDHLISEGHAFEDRPLDIDPATTDFDRETGDGAIGDGFDASWGGDLRLGGGEDGASFEERRSGSDTLVEHLEEQVGLVAPDDHTAAIMRYIIGLLDDAGYLSFPLHEVCEDLGVKMEEGEAALKLVHTLDPAGVGARSLFECIALQAQEADRYDPCMATLIDNLDLVARGEFARLRKMCRVDEEDFADMLAELRGYDPKPGLRFGGQSAGAVTPDVMVEASSDGGWKIALNEATLPKLVVNRRYYVELKGTCSDKASRGWLSEKLADANWLLKALDQRQKTILNVASEIVKQQDGFFRHGVSQLKPLTLRTVADAISMHESTVSRVTSAKYLHCARGTFELKYFFTSGIATAGGEGASAEAVKSAIRKLIESENPKAILSDDSLVELLKAQGYDLARRTVAKYREAIGLGSSVQRRRQKAIAGTR